MKLEILISTINSGIMKVKDVLLPIRSDVSYIISHQYTDDKFLKIPQELIREDVVISQIPGKGLTKSRNNATRMATADICVIADDDVKYTNEYIDNIINTYKENKDIDIALFKIETLEENNEYKKYPEKSYKLSKNNMHWPSSIEISFRLNKIKNYLEFDEKFGLESKLPAGEENIFIHDALSLGLKCYFVPKYIVMHPKISTIKSLPKYARQYVMVSGASDARINGYISIIKVFAVTVKYLPDLIIHNKNPLTYIYERLSGALHILKSNIKT